MNKVFETTIYALLGSLFFGLIFSSFVVAGIAAVCSAASFLKFCKEEEQFKKQLDKEKEKQKIENEIFLKKCRLEERQERQARKAWLKELKELHPH